MRDAVNSRPKATKDRLQISFLVLSKFKLNMMISRGIGVN